MKGEVYMAINVKVTVACDMCGREHDFPDREKWRWGRIEMDVPSVVGNIAGWELLSREGVPVRDYRNGDGKVLCPECARAYREAVEDRNRSLDAMFGGR